MAPQCVIFCANILGLNFKGQMDSRVAKDAEAGCVQETPSLTLKPDLPDTCSEAQKKQGTLVPAVKREIKTEAKGRRKRFTSKVPSVKVFLKHVKSSGNSDSQQVAFVRSFRFCFTGEVD